MGWRDKLDDFAMKQAFDHIFNMFDKDHSGYLQARELSGFLTMAIKQSGASHNVSDGQAGMAMKAVDKNHDGKLSKDQVFEIYKYFVKNFELITGGKN